MSIERKATFIAVIVSSILAISKMSVGILSGSVAVVASAIDSIMDTGVSVFNNIALKISEYKPDKKFNYGKGKIEGLAALFEGLLIIGSGVFIIFEAIEKAIHKEIVTHIDASIYIMIFAIIVVFFLVMYLNLVAKKTDNIVIKSDSLHYKTDLITNSAVLFSLFVVKMTNWFFVDYTLSIIIGIYIIVEAAKIVEESVEILLDASLDFVIIEKIKDIIKKEPLVLDYHCLRTRKAGKRNFVDVHLVLTPDMKLKLAHTIMENVEEKIRHLDKDKKWIINIHADPYDDSVINELLEECE